MKLSSLFILFLFLGCVKKEMGVIVHFKDSVNSMEHSVLSCPSLGSLIEKIEDNKKAFSFISNKINQKSFALDHKKQLYQVLTDDPNKLGFNYYGYKKLIKKVDCYDARCSQHLFWNKKKVQFLVSSTDNIAYHDFLLKEQDRAGKAGDMLLSFFKNKAPGEIIMGMKISINGKVLTNTRVTDIKERPCSSDLFEVPSDYRVETVIIKEQIIEKIPTKILKKIQES